MSKSVKIQDSPEFKAFKENFEATMDAMEKDPEFAQMKLPEEWERDFKETMEATWEEERQRKKKRIGKRIAIAAGVTLVTLAGLNLGVQQVQGEGLVEFFQKTFHLNGKQYTTVNTGQSIEFETNEEEEIIFSHQYLSEVYKELREELKTSIIQVSYVPENYEVEEAKYDRLYNLLNVRLGCDEGYIYTQIERLKRQHEDISRDLKISIDLDTVSMISSGIVLSKFFISITQTQSSATLSM